jgi:hypothetical protein
VAELSPLRCGGVAWDLPSYSALRRCGTSTPCRIAHKSHAEHIHSLKRFVSEFINGGDEAVLDGLVHEDYVYRNPSQVVRGKNELIPMFRTYRKAFPRIEALFIRE